MPLRVYNRVIRPPMQASSMLVILNGAVFAACAWMTGNLQFSPSAMANWGAISKDTLVNGQYWRLVSAGFLHFDLPHLLMNMMWLISFGSVLERRVGVTNFLLIYGNALVFGDMFAVLAQPGPFAGAGASGAISGIMGALLCLQVLGKPAVAPQTLITNIALSIGFNLAFAASIGWRAHLGGFVAGLMACAALDVTERVNRSWLACKFPEFLKLNLAVGLPAVAWLGDAPIVQWTGLGPPMVLALLIAAGMACIKLIDALLARKNGLVICILALALANMVLAFALALALVPHVTALCAARRGWFGLAAWSRALVESACARPSIDAAALAYSAAVLTVLILLKPLRHGLADVGFVPAGLRAARRRTVGL